MPQKTKVIRSIKFDAECRQILQHIGLMDYNGISRKKGHMTINKLVNFSIKYVMQHNALPQYKQLTKEELQYQLEQIRIEEIHKQQEILDQESADIALARKKRKEKENK